MANDTGWGSLLGLAILVSLVATAGYLGAFGQTGAEYYRSCWGLRADEAQVSPKPPMPRSPEEAAGWATCEVKSRRAFFDDGLILAPANSSDNIDRALQKECPIIGRDVPEGSLYKLTLALVEETGGLMYLDHVLPAEVMIKRVYRKKYDLCSIVRDRYGVSRMIEVSPGHFEWERPCSKCLPQ
jgi:hypothetical protein